MSEAKSNEFFAQDITRMSRREALGSGKLIDVSATAKQVNFVIPVAVTIGVWNSYIEWTEEDNQKQIVQNTNNRLWDVLTMLKGHLRSQYGPASLTYGLLVIPRDSYSIKPKWCRLKSVIRKDDNAEWSLTIMLPFED